MLRPADEGVVLLAADKGVVLRPADERLVLRPADEGVVLLAAVDFGGGVLRVWDAGLCFGLALVEVASLTATVEVLRGAPPLVAPCSLLVAMDV